MATWITHPASGLVLGPPDSVPSCRSTIAWTSCRPMQRRRCVGVQHRFDGSLAKSRGDIEVSIHEYPNVLRAPGGLRSVRDGPRDKDGGDSAPCTRLCRRASGGGG